MRQSNARTGTRDKKRDGEASKRQNGEGEQDGQDGQDSDWRGIVKKGIARRRRLGKDTANGDRELGDLRIG